MSSCRQNLALPVGTKWHNSERSRRQRARDREIGCDVEDLAPEICRQRVVVEGLCREPIDAESIRGYLSQLSKAIDMVALMEPVTHQSPLYGWAGWIHLSLIHISEPTRRTPISY